SVRPLAARLSNPGPLWPRQSCPPWRSAVGAAHPVGRLHAPGPPLRRRVFPRLPSSAALILRSLVLLRLLISHHLNPRVLIGCLFAPQNRGASESDIGEHPHVGAHVSHPRVGNLV